MKEVMEKLFNLAKLQQELIESMKEEQKVAKLNHMSLTALLMDKGVIGMDEYIKAHKRLMDVLSGLEEKAEKLFAELRKDEI